MEGAVGVVTGTGGTGAGAVDVGLESKATERLDLGWGFEMDNVCTFEFRTCLDFRTHLDDEGWTVLDDEVDNEEGCSRRRDG